MLCALTAEEVLFVSLGGYCEPAMQLRNHTLRTEAFPFDWMLTLNHEKFLLLLDNDFQFFLDENYLFQHPKDSSTLENSYYECEFTHHQSSNPAEGVAFHLQEITPKYERRIERFRKLREYKAKVIFIRSAYFFSTGEHYYWWNPDQAYITNEQAVTLKKALDRFFPLLDFKLVIVNYTEKKMEHFDIADGVIEFQIRKKHETLEYARLLDFIRLFITQ
ncbi:MAG TPA: DUF1796 family putative cysteine peptidase [Chlamydiales bacterium]|nr:DUF1796 family putative cysteine peptidase [Chlamydiales bacterium]